MTAIQWSDGAPIYRQLKERVVGMMLDGILKPGDALPSVRQVAAEYQLNPITVSRAYQELADEALVEKRRGLGMYVTEEASKKLLASERDGSEFVHLAPAFMAVVVDRRPVRLDRSCLRCVPRARDRVPPPAWWRFATVALWAAACV